MFTDFDFSALDDPTFKEDAVREEIFAPILRRAGYTPTGSMRVQRSKPLTHPFVMIGSKKHPVSVIPRMPARRKIDLAKVRTSLATPCPHCGYQIPPAEIQRPTSGQVQCPSCGKNSESNTPTHQTA
jgi:predicted RNA-binding Zn-ribbon protein involved in translation (DUF1610 family)